MIARVSMLLKSLASLTCFRACFHPGLAKDLSEPRYLTVNTTFLYNSHVVDCKYRTTWGGGGVGEKCLKELIANLPTSLFTSFSLMASFQSFAKYKFYSAGR